MIAKFVADMHFARVWRLSLKICKSRLHYAEGCQSEGAYLNKFSRGTELTSTNHLASSPPMNVIGRREDWMGILRYAMDLTDFTMSTNYLLAALAIGTPP